MNINIGPERIDTPRAAKELAAAISTACFNDEIRAHVARELMNRILPPDDARERETFEIALSAAGRLTTVYDRRFTD